MRTDFGSFLFACPPVTGAIARGSAKPLHIFGLLRVALPLAL
jgi:hypothetical protein